MELTVLVDNNTLIDRYLLAEPGLSLLIEDEEITVLFDVGYSAIFLENAAKLGKQLDNLDYLVLSHCHLDHTWGLGPLIRYATELHIEQRPFKRPTLVAHPEVFASVRVEGIGEIGCLLSAEKLAKHCTLQLSAAPQALSSRLMFLGEIPRRNAFEARCPIGRREGAEGGDQVIDDSALVYRTSKGLVIVTGCSHAGICNIIEYAKEICGDNRVVDIVGGLHLLNPPTDQLQGTLAYLDKLQPQAVHACHCTDLPSKIALSHVVPLYEVGVGLTISYDD